MSSRKNAREYISKSGYIPNRNEDELTALLDSVKRELSYRVKRHLERVDERECSLDAWNCICDALLELHDDRRVMTKILEIDVCRRCPYIMTHIARNGWHCNHQDRPLRNQDRIPDWCQLPDATGESDG